MSQREDLSILSQTETESENDFLSSTIQEVVQPFWKNAPTIIYFMSRGLEMQFLYVHVFWRWMNVTPENATIAL